MLVDSSELLYVYLAADAGLTAEIGAALYGPPGLPTNFTISKAVVFLDVGGMPDDYIPRGRIQYQIRCYGTTAAEAKQVWLAAAAALHRIKHRKVTLAAGDGILQYCHVISEPSYSTEPTLAWPFYAGTVELHFIETYV